MLEKMRERFGDLTDREKILAASLLAVFCVSVAAVSFALVKKKTGDLRAAVDENERILSQIKENKETIREQLDRKKEEERKFENAPPQLLGLLDKLGGESGIDIPESRDMPDETIEKKWIHKSVEIKLRKIGLETLVAFMVRIKNQNRNFPLAVNKLNIKKRTGELNSYDVQMMVSTYTLKEKKEKKTAEEPAKKGKTATPEPAEKEGTPEKKFIGPQ
jgi:hypothetical protein